MGGRAGGRGQHVVYHIGRWSRSIEREGVRYVRDRKRKGKRSGRERG